MTAAGRPAWRLLVHALVGAAAAACAVALAHLVQTGIERPWTVVAGIGATVACSRVYVVVHRHGEVREGLDVAEIAVVALALLLPPAQALLALATGSLLVELSFDRAGIKKAFNIGVRITGAGAAVLPLVLAGGTGVTVPRVLAATAGAALYWVIGAGCTSLLLTQVQQAKLRTVLLVGLPARLLVWAAAVAVGICSAAAAHAAPLLLVAIAALLALLSTTAAACTRAQHDTERLQGVLDAMAGIQAAGGQTHQDAALLEAAHELLPWRDVAIRETPPAAGEVGRPLPSESGQPRWLLARPRPDADPWSGRDDLVLDTLAGTASVTIELAHLQAQVAEQVLVDPLTSLGNRRRLDQGLRALCTAGDAFAVVVLDLDGFKQINDRLGHDVGDAVLEQVAVRLRRDRREHDLVTRLGGDEFVLLLPGVDDIAIAQAVIERITSAVSEPMQVGPWRLRTRTSAGAALSRWDGGTPQDLLRRADERMYADKRSRASHETELVALWQPADRRATDQLAGGGHRSCASPG